MFRMNGVEVELIVKPLRFNDFGGDDRQIILIGG